ncbi:hypothetical protein I4U23_030315 [Adineta vaga]|nr:hypothetical protein I4U23_030315 [Adineta vaga]
MGKIINVSNRLPVTIAKSNHLYAFKPSSGGLKSCLESVRETVQFLWIGWPRLEVDKSAEKQVEEESNENFECLPAYLTAELANLYYEKYCNGTIWPILHEFISESEYRETYFEAYVKANELFANKILETIEDGDTIWIHDYHLMLLPKLIRMKCRKSIKTAFFLHMCWPYHETFRMVPHWEQIYKKNFLNTCYELLNIKPLDIIHHKGRMVQIRNSIFSIQPKTIYNSLETDRTKYEMNRIAEKYNGLDLKFKVYDIFLENSDNNVIFEQIAVPSRENISIYKDYESRVASLCTSLNEKHGRVIEYRHESVDFHYLVALYRSADICIVSLLADGLNLVAFEYIAAQKDHSGVLLLSKFAGCSSIFRTPMQFNPVNCDELAHLIKKAFEMSEVERRTIQKNLFNTIINNTSEHWAKTLLKEMNFT